MMTIRVCPLCSGQAVEPVFPFNTLWNNTLFTYFRCGSCEATFVDPVPRQVDFEKMYSKANYHNKHYSVVNVDRYRLSVQLLKTVVGNAVRLLDFGCGNGAFLLAGKLEGLDCYGVEMDSDTIEFAKKNSGCFVSTFAEMIDSGNKFDAIHLGDVLEHLPDPSALLKELEILLEGGGVFFIEGPLENNPSPVYVAARYFGTFKRMFVRGNFGNHTPTHLFRVDGANQRKFFIERMAYEEKYYKIHETGWPYYEATDRFRMSPGVMIKALIGRIALALGGLPSLGGGTFGNRFAGIFGVGER